MGFKDPSMASGKRSTGLRSPAPHTKKAIDGTRKAIDRLQCAIAGIFCSIGRAPGLARKASCPIPGPGRPMFCDRACPDRCRRGDITKRSPASASSMPAGTPAVLCELPVMPLDSNSRFIAGVCGVAVLLLLTWLHATGTRAEGATPRCATQALPMMDAANDCERCHREQAPQDVVPVAADDAPRPAQRIASTAPRA